MPASITNAQKRSLKAQAQRLDPHVRVGHEGISAGFLQAVEVALSERELVKIKFSDHKEEKKILVPQIAEQTRSEVIMRVGNVAVFYRRKATAGK